MSAPVKRIRSVVRPAAVTINNTETGTITVLRPDGTDTTQAGTSYFKGLTTIDPNNKGDLAGKATVTLDAAWLAAGVTLRKVEMVDANGTALHTVFDDSTGIPGNDTTTLAAILNDLPVGADEHIKLTLNNATGGNLSASARGVFDLGINISQETVLR